MYYFRFVVKNIGKEQAENCEVVLKKIAKENNRGSFVEFKNYTPVNLKWSGVRNPRKKIIQSGRGIYYDLGRIHHPSYNYQSIYVGVTEAEQRTNKFAIELPQSELYYSQWDCLIPGKYRLEVVVYSKNATNVTQTFNITWSGNWQNNEEDMFKELLIS